MSFSRRDFLASSAAIAAGAGLAPSLFAANRPTPLKILFFGTELRAVQTDLEAKYAIDVRKGNAKLNRRAGSQGASEEDNVFGLEHLKEVDLWIGSQAKRIFPSDEQLGHFQAYLAAGKPFVGFRAASHVFQNWLEVDQAVFGARYGGHHLLGKDDKLVVEPQRAALDHPILTGLEIPAPRSGSYKYTELSPDVTVLLKSGLPGDMMPHTWVREIRETGNRVFYTRYDADQIGKEAKVREIFLRGIVWALNRDLSIHSKAS